MGQTLSLIVVAALPVAIAMDVVAASVRTTHRRIARRRRSAG